MWKRAVAYVGLGVLGIPLVLYHVVVPWPVGLRHRSPVPTSFMDHRLREARGGEKALEIRHEWVPLEEVSDNLRRAVIVAEDHRFRDHGPVDWQALAEELHYRGDTASFSLFDPDDRAAVLEAIRYYRDNRDEVKGRSTLTQQLAKNLYFTPERSLVRKLLELAAAQRLEWELSKDRILELYLNVVEWGPGIFGAEAAAREYFGRSASDLTLAQAAALAATLPHPLTSNPALSPGRMRWRQNLILGRLRGGPDPARLPTPTSPPDPGVPDTLAPGG